MSLEKLKEAQAALCSQIISDMETMGASWTKEWNFTPPHNPETGTVYRGRNALLLMYYMRARNLDDPRFMTFNQASKKGYKIEKGCHSYPIEKSKPIVYDVTDPTKRVRQPKTQEEWDKVNNDKNKAIKYVIVGSYNLFNAKNIEGIEPYEEKSNPVLEQSQLIDFLKENSPCEVEEIQSGEACYIPIYDKIVMPKRTQFSSELSFGRVLLHEQSHATGHTSRLDRPSDGLFGSTEYAKEELTAELSSLFTANELGVSFPALGSDDAYSKSDYWQNHVAYLQSWSKKFENPMKEIMSAASRAAAASEYLMDKCFAPALAKMQERTEPSRVISLNDKKGRTCATRDGINPHEDSRDWDIKAAR